MIFCRIRRKRRFIFYVLFIMSAALFYNNNSFLFQIVYSVYKHSGKVGIEITSHDDITALESERKVINSRLIKDHHVTGLNRNGSNSLLASSSAQIWDGLMQARGVGSTTGQGHTTGLQNQSYGDKVVTLGDKIKSTPSGVPTQLKERCQKKMPWPMISHRRVPRFPIPPLISTNHQPKIMFCPMAKVGSTFFTRYLLNLNKPGQMQSPYTIKVEDAKQSGLENLNMFKDRRQKLNFLDSAFKFVFCRNPYWRVFSAYVDKLYSPNPYYWDSWGNSGSRYKRRKCAGAGMSFPSFIDLVVRVLYRKDMHITPMTVLCRLCDVHWDFVGKIEDSVRDIDSLSRLLNTSAYFQHEPGYRLWSALDVISDATRDVFSKWRNEVTRCMTMYDAGRIVWRKLQIRGIIYSFTQFPFSEDEMKSIDLNTFQHACTQAAQRSTDLQRLKAQKVSAFTEAFRMLNRSQLLSLRRVYNQDIFILQYPEWPLGTDDNSLLFSNSSDILNWRKPWTPT